MAIRNLYPNLPAHLVVFKDGGLSSRENPVPTGTKSLLILGTALDGPVNEPVAVDDKTVGRVFGEDYLSSAVNGIGIPNGATLVRTARQAYKSGFDDIRCMRVTGSQATATLKAKTEEKEELLEADPVEVTANGNNEIGPIEFQQSDIADLEADQYPIIKDVCAKYSGGFCASVATDSDFSSGINASVSVDAGTVSARGMVTAFGTVVRVNNTLAEKTSADGIVLADTGTVTSTSVPIYSITVPKAVYEDVYWLEMAGLTPGTAAKDKYGVDIVPADTVPVDPSAANPKYAYMAFTAEDDVSGTKTEVKVDFTDADTSAITDDDGNLVIKFPHTPAGDFTFKKMVYKNIANFGAVSDQVTKAVPVSDYYTPLEIVLENEALADEDIILYNNGMTTAIAKLSDADGVLTYDPASKTVKADLSKVSAGVTLTNFMINAKMKLAYKYKKVTEFTEEISFISSFGGDVYNECSVTVEKIMNGTEEGRLITLTKPESKKYTESEQPLTYSSFDFPTFGHLKQAVESTVVSPLNNVFQIATNAEDALVSSLIVDATSGMTQVSFTGGTNGINPTNDEMFVALSGKRDADGNLIEQGAYQILENYSVDYIYVAGVYSDSTVSKTLSSVPQPFHYQLALLCAVLTFRTKMTHGFIDVKPNSNTTLIGIQEWVEHVTSLPNEFLIRDLNNDIIYDEENKPMDIGWYTSCIVGPNPVCTSDTLGTYYGSPAIAYAALNASLAPESAPTNKRVPGCTSMKFKLSNKQMNEITGNRMVCFKYKNEGVRNAAVQPWVVDGTTCGLPTSDYIRITTVKVTTDVVDTIREVSDPFLGEPNTLEQRNALGTIISKALSRKKEGGVIQWYAFEIQCTASDVLLGQCTVLLELVAPQELRKITTVVSLRPAAQ